jgi:hypothetical protein
MPAGGENEMVKNKLEVLFSKSMKEQFAWGIKLHNNPLAHQPTPADYIVSNHNKFQLYECKQVTLVEGKGRLTFKRLKQMHDLLAFENVHGERSSYFVIGFKDKYWANSEVYIVPAVVMQNYILVHRKVSVNRKDMREAFQHLQAKIDKGVLKW